MTVNRQGIKVEGMKELQRALKGLAKDLGSKHSNNALRSATRAVAADARKEARRNVPRRYSRLYRNIVVKRSRRQSNQWGETFLLSWRVGRGAASHGHLVELGGPHNKATHFLENSADAVRPRAAYVFRAKLEQSIRRAYTKAGVKR